METQLVFDSVHGCPKTVLTYSKILYDNLAALLDKIEKPSTHKLAETPTALLIEANAERAMLDILPVID